MSAFAYRSCESLFECVWQTARRLRRRANRRHPRGAGKDLAEVLGGFADVLADHVGKIHPEQVQLEFTAMTWAAIVLPVQGEPLSNAVNPSRSGTSGVSLAVPRIARAVLAS